MEQTIRNTIITSPPVIDLLLNKGCGASLIPDKILTHRHVRSQSKKRLALVNQLNLVFSQIPKKYESILECVNDGIIDESSVIKLYEQLYDFISDDQYNKRLILYLPFELLPEAFCSSISENLSVATRRFVELYLKKWRMMLGVYDIRANFLDGDIADYEHKLGASPKVCKCAHLIPVLVKKGHLSVKDVLDLITASNNEILRNSIADTIGVLVDMDLLTENDMGILSRSDDRFLNAMSIIIGDVKTMSVAGGNKNLLELADQMSHDLSNKIECKYPNGENKSRSRIAWETERNIDSIIEQYSNQVICALKERTATIEEVRDLITGDRSILLVLLGIKTVRKFCIDLACESRIDAAMLALAFADDLAALRKNPDVRLREYINTTYCHWCNLGIISPNDVIHGNFIFDSLDKKSALKEVLPPTDKEMFEKFITAISSNELSSYFYPVVIAYGSKVKGYAIESADYDFALLVRPEIQIEKRDEVQALLDKVMIDCGVINKPLEFWLEQDPDIRIRNFDPEDTSLGNSSLTHVLWQGVWIGRIETIRNLISDLLPQYLKDSEERSIWMEELERDTLQYRLMHKGYARLYATKSPFNGNHSEDIDGGSTFWDPGYRWLATKLFVSKVYLPKME